jgi:hypothetical protein
VPTTSANWADVLRTLSRDGLGRQILVQATCDDLQLVGLKLVFLVVTRTVSVLGSARREAWWKDAEILMLRHQLTVALRERVGAGNPVTVADLGIFAWGP